jgi:hypothetical protein
VKSRDKTLETEKSQTAKNERHQRHRSKSWQDGIFMPPPHTSEEGCYEHPHRQPQKGIYYSYDSSIGRALSVYNLNLEATSVKVDGRIWR